MTGPIVFDLDGTICFDGRTIADVIRSELAALDRAGWEVVFASARPIRDQIDVLGEDLMQFRQIGANGALVGTSDGVRSVAAFTPAQRTALLELIRVDGATALVDGLWDYHYDGPPDHDIRVRVDPGRRATMVGLDELSEIVKIAVVTSNDRERIRTGAVELGCVVHDHRGEGVLDISPAGIDKAATLNLLGVRDYVAFGNDANDRAMLAAARHAVAVGTGAELAGVPATMVPADPVAVAGAIHEIRQAVS